jgi:signal transduction histidine kinase
MRSLDTPNLLDWLAASVRWLVLLALALSLVGREELPLAASVVFFAVAGWNVALTGLAALRRRLPAHELLVVTSDLVLAGLLFYLGGGSQGGLVWAGLLPVFTAALFFGVRGALLAALLNLIIQGGLALWTQDLTSALLFVGAAALLYLLVGSLFGLLVERMKAAANRSQRLEQQSRREAEKAEGERRRAIYGLISALSASLNYKRVLDTALDLGTRGLTGPDEALTGSQPSEESRLASAVLLYSPGENGNNELIVGSSRRFTPADQRITTPGKDGLIGRAIDDGEPRLSKSLAKDPELSRFVALRTCQAAYCLPLRTGLDTCGVLLFAHPDPEYFTADRREVLDIIGKQATIALQNARLYQDLAQEKERMMEIQEESRKKLARDLHDGPTQSVAALAMRVNFARRLMERDPKAAADELFKIEDLARKTTKEIRHMLFTLRPLVLESQGLVAALESMAEKMRETYNQTVIIEADPETISHLEAGKQGVIFYIAEEAVNNARKHAKAAHVWVRLKPAGEELVLLEVEDDGTGFDAGRVEANYQDRGSLGMINMRERTELLNGVLRIDSAEGKGACISLLVPLSELASDRLRRGQ